MKRKIIIFCISFVLIVVFFILVTYSETLIRMFTAGDQIMINEPSFVDNVSNPMALAHSHGCKTFFVNDYFWLFYSDGTNIVYKTSLDGSVWNEKITIAKGEYGWFIYFVHESREGKNYFHYIKCNENWFNPINYGRGLVINNTIKWDNEQIAEPTKSGIILYPSQIALDSSGCPWLIYGEFPLVDKPNRIWVTKSEFNNGTWKTAKNFPYMINEGGGKTEAKLLGLDDGKMYAICSNMYVYGRLWNNENWEDEVKISNIKLAGRESISAVSKNDVVYVTFCSSYKDIVFCKLVENKWTITAVQNNTCYNALLGFMDNRLFMVYSQENSLFYREYLNSEWNEQKICVPIETSSSISYAEDSRTISEDDSSVLCFAYTLKKEEEYDIYFIYIKQQT